MKTNEVDILIIISTIIILFVVLMMVAIYGVFVKKRSQLMLTQQRKDAVFEQELAISQVEIQEQTLNYIGQELHDDLGQKLSVARLMTNKIALSSDEDRKQIAEEINLLVGECIQDIRNLSKVFITKQIKQFGFIESVEREIFRIKRLELMQVDYHINNHDLKINSDHALILFRIVQECINNVIKHSKSKEIQLLVEDQPEFIKINVNDNGIGFIDRPDSEGSGLRNMKSRAKIINAEFSINSVENGGTKVTIIYKK
ncbi:hypothetical protein CBW16_11975 [Flavobacteriaceae bacterium JJC]|nr:hypothetical protein CBW16_11975 [Flavobacteriaceae bacterium JJC]